jgi:hypothetical protein
MRTNRPLANAGNGIFAVFFAGEGSAHVLNLGAVQRLHKSLRPR